MPAPLLPQTPLPPPAEGALWRYALASAGGVIGFLPLLTLLLPLKVEAIAGAGRIGLLTTTVIAGAVAASLANILFGWLSDRSVARGGGRRPWLAGGLIATACSYVLVAAATTSLGIVLAIVAFQVAINAVLAPLLAMMAEEIPDAHKGLAGGLLSLGNPLASALSAVLVGLKTLDEPSRLAIVWVALAACILPVLLARLPLMVSASPAAGERHQRPVRGDLLAAWAARLVVQIAGNVLFLYLFYYFESMAPATAPATLAPRIGALLTAAFIVPLPIAVLLGRLSDRSGRRKPYLLVAAAAAACGLVGMALAQDWTMAAVAFGLYASGSAVFLALHAGFAMQLLPDPQHRGRDLGVLNLTNTLPALIGPLLTWHLATPRDFDLLMLVLALLTLGGGLTMLAVRGQR